MTLLQFVLIVSSVIFVIFTIDAFQRRRLNFLHFFVFIIWISVVVVFSMDVNLLDRFWQFFWVARWADLIVYISIILLWYMYFELLNRYTKDSYNLSKLVSAYTLQNNFDIDSLKIKKSKDIKDKVLFLVRAYNEEQVVGEVIDDIFWYWFSKIVVVNDGSWDNTLSILKEKQKKYSTKNMIILSHIINRWWGCANKTLFNFVKKYWDKLDVDYVFTYDADGQMSIKDTDTFIKVMKQTDCDVLIGSRFVKWWSVQNMPFLRKIVILWSRIITFVFNGVWVWDPHNWFRLFKMDSLKKVKIYSDGMTYASELLDQIKRLKLKYKEVPVNIRYTQYSLKKWQKNRNAFKILFEIIYKKFFFK